MSEMGNIKFPQQTGELLPVVRIRVQSYWLNVYLIRGTPPQSRFDLYFNDEPEATWKRLSPMEIIDLLFLLTNKQDRFEYEVSSKSAEEIAERIKLDPSMRVFLKNNIVFRELALCTSQAHAQHVLDEVSDAQCKFCNIPQLNN